MANNALPSPATIEGINRAQKGDGKGRGYVGGGWRKTAVRQKERRREKQEGNINRDVEHFQVIYGIGTKLLFTNYISGFKRDANFSADFT